MNRISLIICGLGNVGREFAGLVVDKAESVTRRFSLAIDVVAIAELGGSLVNDGKALPVADILEHLRTGGSLESLSYWKKGLAGPDLIATTKADVVVETTPTSLKDGEPATSHMNAAMKRGMDIVTANKGPMVLFYTDMTNRAREAGSRIFISAATAAALPTLDVGVLSTAGADVLSFEGILNGTTNFILTRMKESGSTYEAALREAQEMGIAETNPTLDVEGFDTANKCVLIANRIFGMNIGLDDVDRTGITGVTPEDIEKATSEGKVIKLIGQGHLDGGKLVVSAKPAAIEKDHPLASISLSEKAISYDTDTMGRITVSGGKSSPVGAAAALLKDVVHTALLR
jgi:homoserine dehydrogenase